jgi:hypothetical protein
LSVIPFVTRRDFDPEMTRAMGIAFDNACEFLGLTDRTDPITETLAMRIIELAQIGVRDPDEIQAGVLATFTKAG